MDWMPSKVKSLSQNVGAFVISNGSFTEVYPQPDHKSSSTADFLRRFCDDVGVPVNLKTDRAKEFVERMTDFMKLVKKRHIKTTYAEPERKNQIIRVDSKIRYLKRRWCDKMRKKNVPERFCDYGLTHASKIMQILPRSQLRDRTALYHAGVHPGVGEQNREVGRWLGVSEHVGSDMCYWILNNNGKSAMVTRRMTDRNGRSIGKAHSNPMLDTRVYEVQLEDGTHDHCLVAMRIARDMIVELRLKLKSIGVPMVGPANVFCDNQGVVKNTSIPESTLSKKHNSINYHI
ncbi:hypothetical protein ACHAWF_008875, partial [Thalassiosira exigua]